MQENKAENEIMYETKNEIKNETMYETKNDTKNDTMYETKNENETMYDENEYDTKNEYENDTKNEKETKTQFSRESQIESPSYATRVRLIDQGTFGCIYRPEIKCETGDAGDYAYVSKIQKMTKTIQNEIEIGNIVKKIPHYMFWYSPLLHTCPIYFSTLKKYEEQGETCKAVNTETANINTNKNQTPNPQFISSKIRYAGKYIINYLRELPQEICNKKIITTYEYIDTAITRLNEYGIIHNDIKENNVLYDMYNHSPNIIDFGISYKIADLYDESKEKAIFYTKKFYPYWCIHVFLLCAGTTPNSPPSTITAASTEASTATPSITEPITEETFSVIYESYMREFRKFAEDTQITRILTQEDFAKHEESYWGLVRPYIGKSWKNDLRPVLLNMYMHWDKYSLAIMYMVILSRTNGSVPPTFVENLRERFANIPQPSP